MKRRTVIKDILLTMGVLAGSRSMAMLKDDLANIQIRMIYNNIGSNPDFVNEWGLSVWIESNDHAVLFDTGGDPSVLEKNIKTAGLNLEKLLKIVISHNHWDHINGLPLILEKTSFRPQIYVPAADLGNFREKFPQAMLTGVESYIKIEDHIWSTGPLGTTYRDQLFYEQSLIIDLHGQLILLTGCAHPGIVSIVKKTNGLFPGRHLNLVAGGFHLGAYGEEKLREISEDLKKMNVERLAASHCTGDHAIQFLKEDWGDRFVSFNNGEILDL